MVLGVFCRQSYKILWFLTWLFYEEWFFKNILLIMLLQFSQFFPPYPSSALHSPTLQCRGALTQPSGATTDEEKDYQDMICLGRKGGRFSQGEKGPEPLSPGTFIRFICIGIQIKLINHCQPVRVKQYMIYRELWGLILSYSQLVRGP